MMLHNCLVCNKKIPFSIFGNPMGACPVLSDRHVVCERCTEKVRQFTTLKTGMYTEASFIKECSKYPELLEFVSSVADNDNLNQLLLHDDDTLISFANELLSYEEIAYLQHIGEEHKRKNLKYIKYGLFYVPYSYDLLLEKGRITPKMISYGFDISLDIAYDAFTILRRDGWITEDGYLNTDTKKTNYLVLLKRREFELKYVPKCDLEHIPDFVKEYTKATITQCENSLDKLKDVVVHDDDIAVEYGKKKLSKDEEAYLKYQIHNYIQEASTLDDFQHKNIINYYSAFAYDLLLSKGIVSERMISYVFNISMTIAYGALLELRNKQYITEDYSISSIGDSLKKSVLQQYKDRNGLNKFELSAVPRSDLNSFNAAIKYYTDHKDRFEIVDNTFEPDISNPDSSASKGIDSLKDGVAFEEYCANLLKDNGFTNIETTKASGDHGVDILAEKFDVTYAVQCKYYSSPVGNKAVQEAHSGRGYYKRDIAVVMTNNSFTPQAKDEADQLGVKLWDGERLKQMIK